MAGGQWPTRPRGLGKRVVSLRKGWGFLTGGESLEVGANLVAG